MGSRPSRYFGLTLWRLLAERAVLGGAGRAALAHAELHAAVHRALAGLIVRHVDVAAALRGDARVVGDDVVQRVDAAVAGALALGAELHGRGAHDDHVIAGAAVTVAVGVLHLIRGDAQD